MNPNFALQLRRQLAFLERSCADVDKGHREEALRIAVSLRVLFHDTPKSISLLTHLGVKSSVQVLSTFEPGYTEDKSTGVFCASMPVWVDHTGERTAPLGATTRRQLIPAPEWWQEVVMCVNSKMSRRDIILGAANQDGGAHVDADPNAKTKELIAGIGSVSGSSNGALFNRVLDNHHFPLLRQIAYEVLNSPDILTAAK